MPMREGWPYTRHPSGWFQIGWSTEIGIGAVRSLHYFDTDLVAFRGASGAPQRPRCPLPPPRRRPRPRRLRGRGGHRCPFHNWRWDAQGRNVCIPYSTTVNRRQRIRTWPVREIDGLIRVWYDADGGAPTWEPESITDFVPDFDPAEFYPAHPHGLHTFSGVEAFPQFISENFVDAAHFLYVHSARAVTTIDAFEANGPFFDVSHSFASVNGAGLHIRASGLGMALGVFRAEGRGPSSSRSRPPPPSTATAPTCGAPSSPAGTRPAPTHRPGRPPPSSPASTPNSARTSRSGNASTTSTGRRSCPRRPALTGRCVAGRRSSTARKARRRPPSLTVPKTPTWRW